MWCSGYVASAIATSCQKIAALHGTRTKTVGWMVSNCNTPSRRESYVHRLMRHVDVDIYGSCGSKRCPKGEASRVECDRLLRDTYHFYLSLENSVCTDYITEKMHTAINNWMIPLVFKAAVYTPIYPPRSFIAVDSFATMRELAAHLMHLVKNVTAYMEYHEWRRSYANIGCNGDCQLCTALHTRDDRHSVRENILDWYGPDNGVCEWAYGANLHKDE